MTRHCHYDVMMEWAADTSKVVQFKNCDGRWENVAGIPWWDCDEYRIKPMPKPDVVRCEPVHLCVDGTVIIKDVGGTAVCRFVFDGETGKLTKAEVL